MTINTVLGSLMKWSIGNEIRAVLMSSDEVSKAVGNRIYPVVAPEGTDGTFIVYRRERYSKTTVHQGVVEDECLVSVTVIDDSYDVTVQIAEAIDKVLYGTHTTSDGKRYRVSLEDSTENFESNKYFQTLVFKVV